MAAVLDYFTWSLIILASAINLITILLIIEIKFKVQKTFVPVFILLLVGVIFLMLVRVFDLLGIFNVMQMPLYIKYIIVTIYSTCLMLAAYKFYKAISMALDKKNFYNNRFSREENDNNKILSEESRPQRQTRRVKVVNGYVDFTAEA